MSVDRVAEPAAQTLDLGTVRLEVEPSERGGPVAVLTLDRPPLNVLDLETLKRLDRALEQVQGKEQEGPQDAPAPQVLFLRGAGDKAFSAGVAVEDHVPERIDDMLSTFHRALARLWELPALTVAAVHGWCLGGGMELAMACDLRLATDDARFGQPEIDVGCYPPFAAALYPQTLGPDLAAELLLTGRRLSALEMEERGLVAWRVARARLEAKIRQVAGELTSRSPVVTALAVKALREGRRRPFPQALEESERIYRQELARTRDMEEGLEAFLEKRPPRWEGR